MNRFQKTIKTIRARKRFFVVMFISSACGILFGISGLFDYVYVLNDSTGALLTNVTGLMIAFGHSSIPFVTGNGFAIVSYLSGCIAGLLTLVFTFWVLYSKSATPSKYLLLAFASLMAVVGLFFAFFAIAMFTGSNPDFAVNTRTCHFTFFGYAGIIFSLANVCINIFGILYIGLKTETQHVLIDGPKQ
ncbi:MAG: hypothetical protein WC366_04595 [Bacilli bacterium]|jgi:hypothetical protein